jgi:hypothetical protein
MNFLIIKPEKQEPTSTTQNLVINKDDVSAVYVEADSVVTDVNLAIGATLVLQMNNGHEFKFKYKLHHMATIHYSVLVEAIRAKSAVEITI